MASGMVVLRLLVASERKLSEVGNALTDEKSVSKLWPKSSNCSAVRAVK